MTSLLAQGGKAISRPSQREGQGHRTWQAACCLLAEPMGGNCSSGCERDKPPLVTVYVDSNDGGRQAPGPAGGAPGPAPGAGGPRGDAQQWTGVHNLDGGAMDEEREAEAAAAKKGWNTSGSILHLSRGSFVGADAEVWAKALKINKSWEAVYLENEKIGPDGAKALAEALKHNASVQTIDFDGNHIGRDGAKALAEALHHNTALQEIRLGHNQIGVAGATALAEALKINKSLKTIYLYQNEIGDDGAKALAEALKINKSLKTIYLSGNKIGPDGAKALAEAMKVNTVLTKSDLYLDNIVTCQCGIWRHSPMLSRTEPHRQSSSGFPADVRTGGVPARVM